MSLTRLYYVSWGFIYLHGDDFLNEILGIGWRPWRAVPYRAVPHPSPTRRSLSVSTVSLKRQMARWQLCSAPLAPLGSTRSARLRSARLPRLRSAPLGSTRLRSAPLHSRLHSFHSAQRPGGCVHDLAEATSPARQTWRLRLRNAKRSPKILL